MLSPLDLPRPSDDRDWEAVKEWIRRVIFHKRRGEGFFRAMRRYKKSDKNAYMYKTYGHRPWGSREVPCSKSMSICWKGGMNRQSECNKDDMFAGPLDALAGCHAEATTLRHWYRMRLLCQRSGFKTMSQFADYVADPESGYIHRNLQGR